MSAGPPVTILDGAMGSLLEQRGFALPAPGWSAHVVRDHPQAIQQIHAEYARAGATVHTACTFRTRRRNAGDDWKHLTEAAVQAARAGVPGGHRVAGSVAPLESCYRPDLSPKDSRAEHRDLALALASCPVDILLCESFPNVAEALVAVEECVATGLETWVGFCAGPQANLLSAEEMRRGAIAAAARGASAVFVNCTAAAGVTPYVHALRDAGVRVGAYANAGDVREGIGWGSGTSGARRYALLARDWVNAGASLIGGCCGTDPSHTAELQALCI